MFVMMNAARFSVGVQGYALADRAYQASLAYARERVQGRDVASASAEPVRLIEHPDVRRMLMDQKSQIEAMRSLAFFTAARLDFAHASPDADDRRTAHSLVEFLTPVVKAWSTEVARDLVSTALQIFGGMGYVEETGIAQYYRDVRIAQIYEGTTGIQATDLLGRKFLRDTGKAATAILAQMSATVAKASASDDAEVAEIGARLADAVKALGSASQWLGSGGMRTLAGTGELSGMFAGAVPFLMLWGYVLGGWMMAKSALACCAAGRDDDFHAAKIVTARYYAEHVLPRAGALAHEIVHGGPSTLALRDGDFDLDRTPSPLAGARTAHR